MHKIRTNFFTSVVATTAIIGNSGRLLTRNDVGEGQPKHNTRVGSVAIPTALVKAFQKGKVVVSVGSGFSRAAGLPSWKDLLQNVIWDCNLSTVIPDDAFNSHDSADSVQFEIAARAGKECTSQVFERMLCNIPSNKEMNLRLDHLFALPFAGVVTWNWDDLLDSSCSILSNDPSHYGEAIFTARPDGSPPPLLKLQGSLNDTSSVVVTKEDYVNVRVHRNAFLERLYCDSDLVVLHIGGGVDEGGIVGPIRAKCAGNAKHFAIVNDATEKQKRDALEKQGTLIISYDSNNHIAHTEGMCKVLAGIAHLIAQS